MGYTTIAYGVDIDRLAAVKGSCDQGLLAKMDRAISEEEHRIADPDCPLSLREALERIVTNQVKSVPNGDHQYVYAMELLCQHLGKALDGQGHIKYLDDLCWDVAMNDFRTPLDLPNPLGFPDARYLNAEETQREYEKFRDVDSECDDSDVTEGREEYVWWLKQCVDEGIGLVTLSY